MRNTDDLCIATVNEHLELTITTADIERSHQIGKLRHIIIKFFWCSDRKNAFNRKEN